MTTNKSAFQSQKARVKLRIGVSSRSKVAGAIEGITGEVA